MATPISDEDVSCTRLPEGGYDYQFIDSPSDSLECPVCLLTLKDPHLLSCCGVKICQTCISGVQDSGKGCPKCRRDGFVTLLDKELQRVILGLKVKCSFGCPWVGELRHMDTHVSVSEEGGCPMVEVSCRNGCGQMMKRGEVVYHEEEECTQRPMEKQIARLQAKMEEKLDEMRKNYSDEIAQLKQTIAEQQKEITDLKLSTSSNSTSPFTTTLGSLVSGVLQIMPKLHVGCIPGVSYDSLNGKVDIVGCSEYEMTARCLLFRIEYQKLLTAIRARSVALPNNYNETQFQDMCMELNMKYTSSIVYITVSDGKHIVKILSVLPSEVDEITRQIDSKIDNTRVTFIELSNQRKVLLKRGDIAKEEVDVIVSATNKRLSVDSRGVASALNRASNGELKRQVEKYLSSHGPLESGDVVITKGGGNLKCKHVFHLAGPASSYTFSDSGVISILQKGMIRVLSEAEKVGAKSLAIPAVGAGSYLLKNELIASTMLRSMKDYQFSSDKTVTDIRIVIFNNTVYPAFVKACTQLA